jgi:hypothetical protein
MLEFSVHEACDTKRVGILELGRESEIRKALVADRASVTEDGSGSD